MTSHNLNLHTSAQVTLTITDVDGVAAMPLTSEIDVWLILPDGTGATSPYSTTISQVGSTNVFTFVIPDLNQAGKWRVVARSSGTVTAASEDFAFIVNPSKVA